jgi:hypothetical protein
MAQRWGLLAMVALVFSVDCDGCKNKVPPPPPPAAAAMSEAARAQEETRLAEQRALDEQHRAEQQRSAAQAEETAKRERTAQEAAEQQRTADKADKPSKMAKAGKADKTSGGRHHHGADDAPQKVLAAHQEIVSAEVLSGPGRTTLHFRSDAGGAFRLLEGHFVMDGTELPTVIKVAERGKSYLLSDNVSAGSHTVTAQLTYQGAKRGVFDYMKGYTFKVTSDEVLQTSGAQAVNFTIVCKEKSGLNTALDKRLFVTVEGRHVP